MPLETSGTLSIGGTTTNRSINLELGRSATATSSLGETDLRDLAGVASGAIGIDDFYGASSGYDVENSIKVQANSGNEWFYRSGPTAGNKRTFTFSFWIKRTQLTGFQADPYLMSQGTNARFHFAGDTLRFMFDGNSTEMEAAGVLRDCSAWYHIVLAVDTTQATNTNRVKMYVNGEDYPFNNNDWPSQNQESSWMSGTSMYFNTRDGDGSYDNSGYWAEVAVIDGSALTPTSFGEYDASGIWRPKDLSGLSFGNQGFYLKFDNAASLGADSSGNGKNVTLNNITSVDQATDTPTNNFCILNCNHPGQYINPPSDGGTFIPQNGVNQYGSYAGTIGVTKGKWYFESYIDMRSTTYGLQMWMGYHTFKDDYTQNNYWNTTNQDAVALYYPHLGYYYSWVGGSRSVTTGLGSIGASGVGKYIGYALDLDNNQITFYYDGNAITNGSNLALNNLGTDTDNGIFALPAFSVYDNNHTVNFGGYTKAPISSSQTDANGYGTFEHAPPSGYYAICTKNLAEYG
jgi:hypothetical protein